MIGVVYDAEDESKAISHYVGSKEIAFTRPGMEIENVFDPETGEGRCIQY